jgi:hypothetical protein
MLRKTLIVIAAAATMAVGMTSLTKPASADVFLGFGFGSPYYGFHHRHHHGYYSGYRPRCFLRTVRVWRHHHWVRRKVRVCRGYHSYGY